jgi:hypothetical protein
MMAHLPSTGAPSAVITDRNKLRCDVSASPVWWCVLLLLGALALQSPQSVAVEEELRAPGWGVAELDKPESAPDDLPPGVLSGLPDACSQFSHGEPAPKAREPHFSSNPALCALNPRAPPA